jgi:ribosomal protein L11 methyltransferase
MPYQVYRIECDPGTRDILIALLAEAGLEAFEETAYGLDAYGTVEDGARHRNVLDEIRKDSELTFREEVLPDKNWNEVWESSFTPIRIGNAVAIRASFHAAIPGVTHDLVIDPKMAFGTGHHATTYLMCELMLELFSVTESPDRILDYGSGTGVLAILAKRCGATVVDAVDIERAAAESTWENAALNQVNLDSVVRGTLDDVPARQPYDLILANINRNVLLQSGRALYGRLRPGGSLLASGILEPDAQPLVAHLRGLGFRHRQTRSREDWRAFQFYRD